MIFMTFIIYKYDITNISVKYDIYDHNNLYLIYRLVNYR